MWSFRSGLLAVPVGQSVALTMIWNWASLTPPDRCRSSCAEMRLEGLATDWLWRRSLDDGGADQHKTKSTTKKEGGWLAQGSTENVFLQKIYFTHSPQ